MSKNLGLTPTETSAVLKYFDMQKNVILPLVKKLDSKLVDLYKQLGKAETDADEGRLCTEIDEFKIECQNLGFHSSLKAHNMHVTL